MEYAIIIIISLLIGYTTGYKIKNNKNKKLKIDSRICTNIECNPKGYANCQDFDSCEKRIT